MLEKALRPEREAPVAATPAPAAPTLTPAATAAALGPQGGPKGKGSVPGKVVKALPFKDNRRCFYCQRPGHKIEKCRDRIRDNKTVHNSPAPSSVGSWVSAPQHYPMAPFMPQAAHGSGGQTVVIHLNIPAPAPMTFTLPHGQW